MVTHTELSFVSFALAVLGTLGCPQLAAQEQDAVTEPGLMGNAERAATCPMAKSFVRYAGSADCVA